jgi:lipopolysaccharide biosynthesis glycosyltransferase
MLTCLNAWDLSQFKFVDQDFLNKFYQNKWKCLPSIYNSLKTFSIHHHHHQSTANRSGLQAITISYQLFLSAAAFLISSIVGGLSLLISLAT